MEISVKDIILILKNELNCFLKSDRGLFVIYLILVLSWGGLFSKNMLSINSGVEILWLLFFSVIISSNFTNSTFISERANGMLEVLLVSGVSRSRILSGKILFVFLVSIFMGGVVYLIGTAFNTMRLAGEIPDALLFAKIALTYSTASFMSISASAWLSIRISNPRLIHFINILFLLIIAGIHSLLVLFYGFADEFLSLFLLVFGVLFYILARREFYSERVTRPVVF